MPAARGVLELIAAQFLWGLLPIYWKLLNGVESSGIVAHRIVWSLLTLWLITRWRGTWQHPGRAHWGLLLLSATLLGGNWLLFIYAVQSGRVLECSLGYFVSPVMSVLLGLVVLKERLSPLRWLSLGLVVAAVAILVRDYGRLPLLALGLATTFSAYSLVRKQLPLEALFGTLCEMSVLIPFALWHLVAAANTNGPAAVGLTTGSLALLSLSGIATVAPVVLSIRASKQLPLSTFGICQYIAPSLQFALAVFVYGETVTNATLLAFGLVWIALGLYSRDALRRYGSSE